MNIRYMLLLFPCIMYGMNSVDTKVAELVKDAIQKKAKSLINTCTGERQCSGNWSSCPMHSSVYDELVSIIDESKGFVHPKKYNLIEVAEEHRPTSNASIRRSSVAAAYRNFSLIGLALSKVLLKLTHALLSAYECDFSLDPKPLTEELYTLIAERGVNGNAVAVYNVLRTYRIKHAHYIVKKLSQENLLQIEQGADTNHDLHGTDQR